MDTEIKLVNKCRFYIFPIYICGISTTYIIFNNIWTNRNEDPLYVSVLFIVIAFLIFMFTIWLMMVGFMKVVIKDNRMKITSLFISKEIDITHITKVSIYNLPGRGRCEFMYLFIDGEKLRLPNPIGEDMKNYRLFYTRIMRLNVPVERVYR